MKKIMVFLLISTLVIFSLQASNRQADIKPAVIINRDDVVVDDFHPQMVNISGTEISNPPLSPENQNSSSRPPEVYTPYWGDDLLVTDQCPVSSNVTRLAMDYDVNGYIYVTLLADHGNSDTIWTYRSTDGGYTWNRGWDMWFWTNDVDVKCYDMRVQAYTAVPWIFNAVIYTHAGDTYTEFRRMKADTSDWEWYSFSGFDNARWLEMDITDEIDPHIYLAISDGVVNPYVLERGSSADLGSLWYFGNISSVQRTYNGFDICAGPDDMAYAVYYYNSPSYVFSAIYTNYFINPLYTICIQTDNDLYYPCISSARHHSYPTNYVHVVYQSGATTNTSTRCYEIVSSDGGQAWTPFYYFLLGNVHTVHPFVTCNRYGTTDEFTGLATRHWSSTDSIAIGYKYAPHVNWNLWGYRNQHRATTGVTPQGAYISVGSGGGTAFIYREYGSNNIWYDRQNHYNVVEEIGVQVANITYNHNQVMFSFSLPHQTSGKVEIYDLMGRNVKTLYQGDFQAGPNQIGWYYRADDVSSGNYIMLLTVPGKTISEKFTIIN